MAADHITWVKYRNNATSRSVYLFFNKSGNFVLDMRIFKRISGFLRRILIDSQSKTRKVLLFLGFCYNSRQQER